MPIAPLPLAWLLVGLALTPPPPSSDQIALDRARGDIEEAIAPCGATAHGVAVIVVEAGARRATVAETFFLTTTDRACLRRVLRATPIARLPAAVAAAAARWSYLVGAPRSILGDGFLAAWQRGRLSRLPHGLTVAGPAAGCLRLRGPIELLHARDAWLARVGRPVGNVTWGETYALPGDWWIQVDDNDRPAAGNDIDQRICLDHVTPAVSAVRAATPRLWDVVAAGPVTFDAVWEVDTTGRVAGSIRICQRSGLSSVLPDAGRIETLLASLDYGPRARPERLTLRYGPSGKVVSPAPAPAPAPAPGACAP